MQENRLVRESFTQKARFEQSFKDGKEVCWQSGDKMPSRETRKGKGPQEGVRLLSVQGITIQGVRAVCVGREGWGAGQRGGQGLGEVKL